jgi:hypothetical protein
MKRILCSMYIELCPIHFFRGGCITISKKTAVSERAGIIILCGKIYNSLILVYVGTNFSAMNVCARLYDLLIVVSFCWSRVALFIINIVPPVETCVYLKIPSRCSVVTVQMVISVAN